MKINELYISLEGEGVHQGYLTTFIRFHGCNLDCKWCDTKHGKYFDIGLDEILRKTTTKYVTITGGEPFKYQKELLKLVMALKEMDKEISIYTNNTFEIPEIYFQSTRIILDYKMDYLLLMNQDNLRNIKNGVIKFVISDLSQFKHIKKMSLEKALSNNNQIHITSAYGILEPKDLANVLISEKLDYIKLSLQQHKYIWNPDQRGI